MKWMQVLVQVLGLVVSTLVELLSPVMVRKVADGLLDKVEKKVADSATKIDDILVLPIITHIFREPFGIEDNDDGDDKSDAKDTPPPPLEGEGE